MSQELGIAAADLERFAQDDQVYFIVSWTLQNGLFDIDLIDFSAWHLARRIFVAGYEVAPDVLELDYDGYDGAEHWDTAVSIAAAFTDMDDRRRELGMEAWGNVSKKWRVYYGVLEMFLCGSEKVVAGLCETKIWVEIGPPGFDEEVQGICMNICPAVKIFAEVMREEGDYDPILRADQNLI